MEQVDRCLGCGLSWRERAQGFVGRKNKRTRGGIIYPHEIRNLPLEEGTNPPDNNKRAVATGKWVFLSFQHTTMPVHTPNQLSAILMRYGLAPWMFSEGETTCNQLRLHSSGHSCQQGKTFRVIWCILIYLFYLSFFLHYYFYPTLYLAFFFSPVALPHMHRDHTSALRHKIPSQSLASRLAMHGSYTWKYKITNPINFSPALGTSKVSALCHTWLAGLDVRLYLVE